MSRSSPHRLLALLLLALALAACARPPAEPEVFEREGQRPAAPRRALIEGVPFVSWNEAARLWYRDRDRANPSSHAAFQMVLEYWGLHWAETEDQEAMRRWGAKEARRATGLDELKPFIASGIPVIAPSALTPIAHPLSPTRRALAATRGIAIADSGSGVLGTLVPLETVERAGPGSGTERWEFLLATFRVLVGYDDEARVVTLHDPTFGPAWKVPYPDFERMWSLTDRAYMLMRPHDRSGERARVAAAAGYRGRTADESAATDFAFAAALAAAGRGGEAQERLSRALTQPGLAPGYEHLLRLELATQLAARGRTAAAITEAERAAALVPEHHRPWALLAELYRRASTDTERAAEADARARTLAACAELAAPPPVSELGVLPEAAYLPPQRAVAAALAHDFFVTVVCPGSGTTWLLRPPP